MEALRLFFIGDELVAGQGDSHGQGWVGRVLARTQATPPLLPFVLAAPEESTDQLMSRWEGEVMPRLGEGENRLVVSLGSHDLDTSLSLARSRLHVANLLDRAIRQDLAPFVVGPPPRLDQPARDQRELTKAFAEVCARRNIPFVDTYNPLVEHEQWATDLKISPNRYTPLQTGYALITWLVMHRGWHAWLGIPEVTTT